MNDIEVIHIVVKASLKERVIEFFKTKENNTVKAIAGHFAVSQMKVNTILNNYFNQ